MTCRLIANNSRPCDGQPGRMCPSDCDVDCDFNSRTLDKVMNYPLRRVQANEFPAPAEPEANHPYDWLEAPEWLGPVLLYIGAGLGIGYGLYRYFF